MIKRLFQIAVLTGSAHIFTIIALKFLSLHATAEEISVLGEIDSLFQLIINIVALGLQLSAVRYIATSPDWRDVYGKTQTARMSMSVLLIPLAFLSLFKPHYIYFLLAPLFALSGDYALYARSRPVQAAALAFFRVALPSFSLIVIIIFKLDLLIPAYILTTINIYLLTNKVISNILQVPVWFSPSLKSLKLYISSFYLGLTVIFWYMLGLGMVIIVPYFYNTQVTAVAYIGLKIYMVFKGVLRIANQAFVKEMINDDISLKVDQLCMLAGLSFVGLALFFPGTIAGFLFSSDAGVNSTFLLYLSIAGLMCSLFISYTTRAILFHKDYLYAKYSFIAVVTALSVVVLFSFFRIQVSNIGIGLLAGESCLAAGLALMDKGKNVKPRVYFLFQASLLLLAILPVRLYWGDTLTALIIGFSAYFIIAFFIFYKKFSVTI